MREKSLFTNKFVQAIGVGVVLYLGFWGVAISTNAIMRVLTSFAWWYQYSFMRAAEEVAGSVAVLYLILSAVIFSKHD